MAFGVKYYWDEAKYRGLKTYRMVQGKLLHIGLRGAMGGGAAAVASDLSYPMRDAMNVAHPTMAGTAATQAAVSTGEIILSSTGGLLSIGLGAGISAYMNHLDHKHRLDQLCTIYSPQIAEMSKDQATGQAKTPENVSVADLKEVAEINPTLKFELARNDKKRTVKNIAAIAGTVVAFAAVFTAITFVPALGALAATAATAGLLSQAGMAFAVAAGGIGYASMHLARKSFEAVGKKLLSLDKPTSVDKILVLSKLHDKGVDISPQQVKEVLVTANPELASSIDEKQTAEAINKGEISPMELTFIAHGQSSGAFSKDPWRERIKDAAQEKIDAMREKFNNWQQERENNKLSSEADKSLEKGELSLPEEHQTNWRDKILSQRAAVRTVLER